MNRLSVRILATVLLPLAVIVASAEAQQSLGHGDPADTGPLLDYRLPTWGWSTWTVSGRIDAHSTRYEDERQHDDMDQSRWEDASLSVGELNSAWAWRREGEQRVWSLTVDLDGAYRRRGSEIATREVTESQLDGRYQVEAGVVQYLFASDLAAVLTARGMGAYQESRRTVQPQDSPSFEQRGSSRERSDSMAPGVAFGRLRDVTPLIRAARLSERLQALGRPALTRPQLQQVAEVLARQAGYQAVYDRPDKRFWLEVLQPIVGGAPLSAAEVYYLRDVLREDLGPRMQGQLASVRYAWSETPGWDQDFESDFERGLDADLHLVPQSAAGSAVARPGRLAATVERLLRR